MEESQLKHIIENLHDLVRLTECNTLFLSEMESAGVLSVEDIAILEARSNKFEKNKILYDVVVARVHAYDTLCKALEKTKQSGALAILKKLKSTDSKSEMESILAKLKFDRAALPTPKPLPELPSFYIKRSLRTRYNLKKGVFQSSTKNVFLVEGAQWHQLTGLATGYRTDMSGNQIGSLTVRHILLECEEDYDEICKLSPEPVHWIQSSKNSLRLVKSTQTVCIPQKYVDDAQDVLTEDEIASKTDKAIIIYGSPGVGKTMLLQIIAHHKRQKDPKALVILLMMKELVQEIHRELIVTMDSIIMAIAKLYNGTKIQEEYLKQQMISGHCTLLLDGVDEVLKPHIWVAKQILRMLLKLDSTCLYITTRPHLLLDLENDLHTLGFAIKPFTVTDQRNFFVRFWESEGLTINESVNKLAVACLNTLAYKMKDFERNIAGIPLQCRILAEVYKGKAIRCSKVKFEDVAAPAPFTSIFEMYKRHIDLRISEKDKRYKSIIHTHMFYALTSHFPELTKEFQSILLNKPPISDSHILRLGILEVGDSNMMRFVHQTFAEYFIAWFAFDKTFSKLHQDFILTYLISTEEFKKTIKTPVGDSKKVNLFYFNYPAICYFINGFMKKEFQQNVDGLNVRLMLIRIYSSISQAMIASAFHNYTHFPYAVARFFKFGRFDPDTTFADAASYLKVDFTDLLITAALYSDVEMMELIGRSSLRNILQVSVKTEIGSFSITPLHLAIQRGDYKLVEFLVDKYKSVLQSLRFLFHFCVFKSNENSRSTLENKKQIILLLSSLSQQWIIEPLDDTHGTIPLVQKDVHEEVLECLRQEVENL